MGGTPKYAAERLALRCIVANRDFLQTAMPATLSVAITITRLVSVISPMTASPALVMHSPGRARLRVVQDVSGASSTNSLFFEVVCLATPSAGIGRGLAEFKVKLFGSPVRIIVSSGVLQDLQLGRRFTERAQHERWVTIDAIANHPPPCRRPEKPFEL